MGINKIILNKNILKYEFFCCAKGVLFAFSSVIDKYVQMIEYKKKNKKRLKRRSIIKITERQESQRIAFAVLRCLDINGFYISIELNQIIYLYN